jgi:membrane associated rhomboid family serine protease
MIPLGVDVPLRRLPWANWGLILATVAVSLAVPYLPGERFALLPAAPAAYEVEWGQGQGASFTIRESQRPYSPLVLQPGRFRAYQLVTALFQHAGLLHLFGNMLFLFVFGNAVNAKLGHPGYLAAYLGVGCLVSLAWLVVGMGAPCLGASGAIMGTCGMFVVLYPRNGVKVFWDEMELALVARSWTGELPGWAVVALYLAFDVWGLIFERDSGVAYVAHILGGLLGVGLAVALLHGGWLRPDVGEQTLLQWLRGEGPVERKKRRKKPPLAVPAPPA